MSSTPGRKRNRDGPASNAPRGQIRRTSSSLGDPSSPSTPNDVLSPSDLEAEEDRNILEDVDDVVEEEPEGEDLIGDNMEDDYRRIDELDRYDPEDLDEGTEYDPMSVEARMAAEREMDVRAGRRATTGRAELALRALMDAEFDPSARRRRAEDAAEGRGGDDDDLPPIALEDYKGPIMEFLVLEPVQKEVKKRFKTFLSTHIQKPSNRPFYVDAIRKMTDAQRASLEVSFVHLSQSAPLIAVWIADCPSLMLPLLDETALEVVKIMVPNYPNIQPVIHVRITSLPISDNVRDLRQVHLNSLVKVGGVVTRRTGVFPQLNIVKYNCAKCGFILGPYTQNTATEIKPGSCPECQSKGPFNVNEAQTIYRNYQKITLQESPGTVPPGRLPRSKEVILLADLIDSSRPGEEIEVTGIFTNNFDTSLNSRHGFPVFATVLEAVYVEKASEALSKTRLTEEEKGAIHKLSKDPHIGDRIIQSMAPSIYGHRNIKTALAMALFGGQAKDVAGKHRIRGDINVLLIGDPGTAKSQCLKFVEKTAHRSVFSTGQGASAVGLTAAVHRDPVTREFTLEGGALVLADRGVCMIDEFDKMSDQDRTSIHEAMEQQSISISKAGIVTTLQARCSVIAAANPIRGRYDPSLTLSDNVDLTEPLLSRFDIICILRDTVEPLQDEHLAKFVVESHIRSHPESKPSDDVAPKDDRIIDHGLLRKYIMYARQTCNPRITGVDRDKITSLYAELRKQIAGIAGGVQVSVRHIESLIRMAEAHARMHLRDYVVDEDVNLAIQVLLESFIDQQKQAVKANLKKTFARYIVYKRDSYQIMLHKLEELIKETILYKQSAFRLTHPDEPFILPDIEIKQDEFELRVREIGISDVSEKFYSSSEFQGNHFHLDSRNRLIIKRSAATE